VLDAVQHCCVMYASMACSAVRLNSVEASRLLASRSAAVASPAAARVPAASLFTTTCATRQDMLTISDIYKDDLPDDSIFVLEYPSSHKDNIGNPMFLVNSSRYLVSSDNRRSPAY